MTRKPKFRVGQVVSVKGLYGNFSPGQIGPGFKGKLGWRHGFEFGKIVKINETAAILLLPGWMDGGGSRIQSPGNYQTRGGQGMTHCEDCGEETKRRTKCRLCGLMVCRWCLSHVHEVCVGSYHYQREREESVEAGRG